MHKQWRDPGIKKMEGEKRARQLGFTYMIIFFFTICGLQVRKGAARVGDHLLPYPVAIDEMINPEDPWRSSCGHFHLHHPALGCPSPWRERNECHPQGFQPSVQPHKPLRCLHPNRWDIRRVGGCHVALHVTTAAAGWFRTARAAGEGPVSGDHLVA